MPQEPKKRHSKQRQGKRRAAIKLKAARYILCSNCKSPMPAHIICKNCGYYKGRKILDISKKEKKEEQATSPK